LLLEPSEKLLSSPCASRKKYQVSADADDDAWLIGSGEGERSIDESDIDKN